jgi:arylsulfatase
MVSEKPLVAAPHDKFVYFPNTQSVPFFAAPRTLNRPHSITADVEMDGHGAEGVLLCQGTAAGGFTFFVQDDKLCYAQNFVSRETFSVTSDSAVPSGRHELRFEFEPTGELDLLQGHGAPGRFQLYCDGKLVGDTEVPYTTPVAYNPGALTCGANPGSAVVDRYMAPYPFTGTINRVTVDVSGDLITDSEAELRLHMARQ